MTTYIDINKSETCELPFLNEDQFRQKFGKGWSFSSVFHFTELRNIYVAVKQIGYSNLKDFTNSCIVDLKIPYVQTPWDGEGRRILEHVNALKNFGLLDGDYQIINANIFRNSTIGPDINDEEKQVFKSIFFSYFRFKEIMSWFIDPIETDRDQIIDNINHETLEQKSKVMFPFFRDSRFTNSFLYDLKDHVPIYIIPNTNEEKNEDYMRFWDVFVKWGQELSLIEKFNLKNLDYQLSADFKSFSCIYFIRPITSDFGLLGYLKERYRSKYINIPKLIFNIAIEYRFSIEDIKKMIIEESKTNSEYLSLQRTSEIFIRETEINFVPVVSDSYMSHILIQ